MQNEENQVLGMPEIEQETSPVEAPKDNQRIKRLKKIY